MRKITSLLLVAIVASLGSFSAKAQISEADYVKDWKFPVSPWYVVGGGVTYTQHEHKQMWAKELTEDFDPSVANFNFNKYWNMAGAMTDEKGKLHGVVADNAVNRKGDSDFSGEIRAIYNDDAVFVFLKAKDEDITGRETAELMLAPYYKIDKILELHPAPEPASQGYLRYSNLGGSKPTMSLVALDQAPTSLTSVYAITYNSTKEAFDVGNSNDLLSSLRNKLIAWNHTKAGADSLKIVYQIGWDVFIGDPNGPRNEYNKSIWAAAEHTDSQGDNKKYYGFAFDIKFCDADADDVPKPNQNGGDYFWNTTDNEGYASNMYTGFIGKEVLSSVKEVNAEPIFGNITKDKIEFLMPTDVNVYSTVGHLEYSAKKVNAIDLNNLNGGVYIVNAAGQALKIVR